MESGRLCLTTNNLSVGYTHKAGSHILFAGLDLSLTAGEMICFMGPNGAGKSSLLRTLAGLQKPLSGSVHLLPLTSRKKTEHQIAIVTTDNIRTANLSVRDVVTFGRYPHLGWNIKLTGHDKKIVGLAIEQLNIQSLVEKKLFELSDGQLQMVMIARAVAQDTPIVILDEPTAHLDLNNRVEIMNMLRLLSRTSQKAILLATHELDLALQTADKIWLTGTSRNILQGFPEDLVLNGAFDDIFRFKGFDLKTGKVRHLPFKNVTVDLRGEGPLYFWAKNALERNGYEVTTCDAAISVTLVSDSPNLKWVLKKSAEVIEGDSLEKLIKSL